jgi:hypothetical protein
MKQKPDLSHLHVYGYHSYPYIKNIPCTQKLKPRAHLGYLVGYDSTNIYRIWVPSLEKVMRTRDVTFDESKLYDPTDLDIGHALREEIAKFVELVETPDTEEEEYERDDEIEDLDTIVVINSNASNQSPADSSSTSSTGKAMLSDSSSSPSGHLPTPDNTPEPDNNAPTPLISANFDAQNILPEGSSRIRKPRRQAYAVQLANTAELSPFYTAFAAGLLTAQPAKRDGQHRDTLPAEPRNWKQMLRHRFSSEFQLAAEREIQELTKRDTYKWVSKEGGKTECPKTLRRL